MGAGQQREHLQRDLGIALPKTGQYLLDFRYPQMSHRHPHRHLADDALAKGTDAGHDSLPVFQQLFCLFIQCLASHSERNALGAAFEQADPQGGFQSVDLTGQCRLGDMHPAAGRRNGAFFHDGDKIT